VSLSTAIAILRLLFSKLEFIDANNGFCVHDLELVQKHMGLFVKIKIP